MDHAARFGLVALLALLAVYTFTTSLRVSDTVPSDIGQERTRGQQHAMDASVLLGLFGALVALAALAAGAWAFRMAQ
jgi:hypothetical protein